MPITRQPLLVAPGLGQCLPQGDTNVLDRVMGIDVQIAGRLNIQVDQAMPGNLVEHVVKEGNTGGKFADSGTIEIETHAYLRLQRVACDFGLPHG